MAGQGISQEERARCFVSTEKNVATLRKIINNRNKSGSIPFEIFSQSLKV